MPGNPDPTVAATVASPAKTGLGPCDAENEVRETRLASVWPSINAKSAAAVGRLDLPPASAWFGAPGADDGRSSCSPNSRWLAWLSESERSSPNVASTLTSTMKQTQQPSSCRLSAC
jgi:hypothetical protein